MNKNGFIVCSPMIFMVVTPFSVFEKFAIREISYMQLQMLLNGMNKSCCINVCRKRIHIGRNSWPHKCSAINFLAATASAVFPRFGGCSAQANL